jgi:D-threo-aldose 1-dehydrogenase
VTGRRVHSRTGLSFTELDFGSGPIGNFAGAVPEEQAQAAVDAAWECGVRVFDTAPHYGVGLAERRLGRALAGRPRDEYVLTTKVGRLLVPDPDGAGRRDDQGFDVPADWRREWDFSRDGVRRSLEESLQRLGLDRIDLVLVHDPDEHEDVARREAIPALIELREQGVVRAVGAGMNQAEMLARFVRDTDVDIVLVAGRWTLLDRTAGEELLPLALERGVGVIAAAPFNSGVLATSEPSDETTFDYAPASADVLARARRLASVAAQAGVPLPAAALQFPLRHPAVLTVAAGFRSAREVREAVDNLAAPVPAGLWAELDAVVDDPARNPASP